MPEAARSDWSSKMRRLSSQSGRPENRAPNPFSTIYDCVKYFKKLCRLSDSDCDFDFHCQVNFEAAECDCVKREDGKCEYDTGICVCLDGFVPTVQDELFELQDLVGEWNVGALFRSKCQKLKNND